MREVAEGRPFLQTQALPSMRGSWGSSAGHACQLYILKCTFPLCHIPGCRKTLPSFGLTVSSSQLNRKI